MSQRKPNNVRGRRKLSSCSVRITCDDYNQRNIQVEEDNQMTGATPVTQRNGPSAYDNSMRHPNRRTDPQLNNLPIHQSQHYSTEAGIRNGINRDLNNRCDDNTYAAILERFNVLKERMAESSKKGFCTVSEEENQKFDTDPGKKRGSKSTCPQDTERIMTTKIGGSNCDYVKETVIERSTLTREGVLTTTRHIIEKCDTNGNIDYEIKESNRLTMQNQGQSKCINDISDSGIGRSCMENPNDGFRARFGSTQGNGLPLGQGRPLSERDRNYSAISRNNGHIISDPSSSQQRNSSLVGRSNQIPVQGMPSIQKRNEPVSRQQMRGSITDDLDEESMPPLESTLANTDNVHDLLKCCPCVCQLCAMKLMRSLSLPERRTDAEDLPRNEVDNRGDSRKVDYYLVGEFPQKYPSTGYDSTNFSNFDKQPLSSTEFTRGAERECVPPQNFPNEAYQQFYNSTPLASEQLQDVSAPSYRSPTDFSSRNQSYTNEQLDNVSAPFNQYTNEQLDNVSAPFNQYTNEQLDNVSAPFNQYTNEQLDNVSAPFNHSSPRGSSTNFYESENLCDVSPPTFQSDENCYSEPNTYQEQSSDDSCENQRSEHISNVSEPQMYSTMRSDTGMVSNVTDDEYSNCPPDTSRNSKKRHQETLVAFDVSEIRIEMPSEFNRDLPEPGERSSPKNLHSQRMTLDTTDNSQKYPDEVIADITPPFEISSEERTSTTLENRTHQKNVAHPNQESLLFHNEQIENITEPTGWETLNNESEKNVTLDASKLDDETPPTGMESSLSSSSKKRSSKPRRSSVSPKTVRRYTKIECQQVMRPLAEPVIYPCPGACECTNPRGNGNARRIRICEERPAYPPNCIPPNLYFQCEDPDPSSPRRRNSKNCNRKN